jgi:hypothetical protein
MNFIRQYMLDTEHTGQMGVKWIHRAWDCESGGFSWKWQRIFDSYNKSQRDALFLKFIFIKDSTCFGQIYCPSSGVSPLYTQQYVFVVLFMWTLYQTINITSIVHLLGFYYKNTSWCTVLWISNEYLSCTKYREYLDYHVEYSLVKRNSFPCS